MLGGLLDAYNMNLETGPLTASASKNGKSSERTFSNADSKEKSKAFLQGEDVLELGNEADDLGITEESDIRQGINNLLKNRYEAENALKELPEFVKQALTGAKLENNQAARQIAVLRFNAGMSINKEALLNDLMLTRSFGKENIAAIVNLERLGLEVNQVNIEGFDSVMNTQGQLLELIDGVIDEIADTVFEKYDKAYDHVNGQTYDQTNEKAYDQNCDQNYDRDYDQTYEQSYNKIFEGENWGANIAANEVNGKTIVKEVVDFLDKAGITFTPEEKELLNESFEAEALGKGNIEEHSGINNAALNVEAKSKAEDAIKENTEAEKNIGVDFEANIETSKETDALKDVSADSKQVKVIEDEEENNKAESGKAENNKVENSEYKQSEIENSKTRSLRVGNGKERLKYLLKNKLLLKPENISSKEKTENYFKEIKERTESVLKAIRSFKENRTGELSKNTNKVSSNLNIVSALNKFINYVELPLKLTDGEAKGELYVYTRKGTRQVDKNNASIYIDLELPKLKTLGIMVKITSAKLLDVTFMSDSENGRQHIKQGISELKDELTEMGYKVVTEVTTLKEKDSDIKEFLSLGTKQSIKLSEFDVKA
ncbi:MAG: flagellar hook-length control protein FliK [Lachnospiraceae bacterium]|nr:flagellar hook-length control protein FliK [Lachnospiraceae bacterium]